MKKADCKACSNGNCKMHMSGKSGSKPKSKKKKVRGGY